MEERRELVGRIKELIAYTGMSVRQFEMRCEFSNGFINNLRNSIGSDKLSQIHKQFPEINIMWLISGEGVMLKSDEEKAEYYKMREIEKIRNKEEFEVVFKQLLQDKDATIKTLNEQITMLNNRIDSMLKMMNSLISQSSSNRDNAQ